MNTYSFLILKSDEELVAKAQSGDTMSSNILYTRYLGAHRTLGFTANARAMTALDEWTIIDAFVDSLLLSVKKFDPTKQVLFKTFLSSIYAHALSKALHDYYKEGMLLSLDTTVLNEHGSSFVLADVTPAMGNDSDPVAYVNLVDLENALKSIKGGNRKVALKMIEALRMGYTVKEASKIAHVSYSKGRLVIAGLKKALIKQGYLNLKTTNKKK